jgi:hypothetical protein
MQLSMTIGAIAVALGVVLAGGYAVGEDGAQPGAKAAVEEQQKPKEPGK